MYLATCTGSAVCPILLGSHETFGRPKIVILAVHVQPHASQYVFLNAKPSQVVQNLLKIFHVKSALKLKLFALDNIGKVYPFSTVIETIRSSCVP